MATKHICDRCGKDIYGYSTHYNQIKFDYFVRNHKQDYGPIQYVKDLCESCIKDLIEFLKEPVVK